MSDPYAVLGVEKHATQEEVRLAYRTMAKRWHPDRFSEGPERMWAEDKMAQINQAYAAIQAGEVADSVPAEEQLDSVRRLIANGQLMMARQTLVSLKDRSPEWNYLFGAVLSKLGEYEKAVLYYGIAARLRPQNAQYAAALAGAEATRNRLKTSSLSSKLKEIANKYRVR